MGLKMWLKAWWKKEKRLFDRELELRSEVYALTSQLRVLQRQQTQMFRVIMFVADTGCTIGYCNAESKPCPSCAAKSFLGLHGLENRYSNNHLPI